MTDFDFEYDPSDAVKAQTYIQNVIRAGGDPEVSRHAAECAKILNERVDVDNTDTVATLRKAILVWEEILAQKTEYVGTAVNAEDLREANVKLQQLARETTESERRKSLIQPQYEMVRINRQQRVEAANYNQEIADYERRIKQAEQQGDIVEHELSLTTKLYKDETNQRLAFMRGIDHEMESLLAAVRFKMQSNTSLDASDELEMNAATVRAREKAYSALAKEVREHTENCRIMDLENSKLQKTIEQSGSQFRLEKDENIYKQIARFQEERAKLHVEIEDMTKVYSQMSAQLRAGEHEVPVEHGGFGRKSVKNPAPDTYNQHLTDRMVELREYNGDIKDETNKFKDEITKMTKAKGDAIKDEKHIQLRIKRERDAGELELGKMDNQISATKAYIQRVCRENNKLALVVKQMTTQAQMLKLEAAANKHKTVPLPTLPS